LRLRLTAATLAQKDFLSAVRRVMFIAAEVETDRSSFRSGIKEVSLLKELQRLMGKWIYKHLAPDGAKTL
jgi:hypothetical protein